MNYYKKCSVILVLLVHQAACAMTIQKQLQQQWEPDKEICFARMKTALEHNSIVPFVHESGELRAIFDGSTMEVMTCFPDSRYCITDFDYLFNLLDQPYTRYLSNGIIYDENDRLLEDVSIEAMHRNSKSYNEDNAEPAYVPIRKTNKRSVRAKNAVLSSVRKNYQRIKEYVKTMLR